MILHKCPRRLASARAGCLLDGGGFDGYQTLISEGHKYEFIFLNVELGMRKVKLLCPPLADKF